MLCGIQVSNAPQLNNELPELAENRGQKYILDTESGISSMKEDLESLGDEIPKGKTCLIKGIQGMCMSQVNTKLRSRKGDLKLTLNPEQCDSLVMEWDQDLIGPTARILINSDFSEEIQGNIDNSDKNKKELCRSQNGPGCQALESSKTADPVAMETNAVSAFCVENAQQKEKNSESSESSFGQFTKSEEFKQDISTDITLEIL